MIGDRYFLNLDAHEYLALRHVISEWVDANPHIGGPCAQFVQRLIAKVAEHPYPEAAAQDYQQLLRNYKNNLITPAFACPKCGAGVELGEEGIGAFCFQCSRGFPRESLKAAGVER